MSRSQRFSVRNGDRTLTVSVDAAHDVWVEGVELPFTVQGSADGAYLVRDGTRSWRVFVVGPADARRVSVDGAVACLEVLSATAPRNRPRSSHSDVASAPMPASVIGILVDVGQTVRHGQVVLTLEAMKMELPIRAPKDGVVTAIHCRAGELVQPGVALIDIS